MVLVAKKKKEEEKGKDGIKEIHSQLMTEKKGMNKWTNKLIILIKE